MSNFWGAPKPATANLTGQVSADKSNEVNPPQFGPALLNDGNAIAFIPTDELYRRNKRGDVYQKEKFIIHRSAILAYKSCPYKYYLEYAYGGHGLSHHQIPQHLLIGICIHRGLQHLLEHCRVEHPSGDFTEKCIDDSVMWAHSVYAEILGKRTLELKKSWDKTAKCWIHEDLNHTVREIANLIEALIRAYAAFRLKNFLDEYEVLEVEQEEVFDDFSDIVLWLGKADALVRRKKDNALLPISFKTAADFNNSTMSNILIDMQGCSEIYAIEDRLNKLVNLIKYTEEKYNEIWLEENGITEQLYKFLYPFTKSGQRVKVFANQYEYLVKGKHRADSSEPTLFKYQTHLLHALKVQTQKTKQLGAGLSFGITSNQSGYEWVIPPGKLPAGKRKISIVDDIGIKEWIHMLSTLQVQPEKGNPFEDVIYAGEERLAARTQEQLKEWRISTQFEAEEIAGYIQVLEGIRISIEMAEKYEDRVEFVEKLSALFQEKLFQFFSRDGKDAQICYDYYGGSCPFAGHCHEGVNIEDALESGLYIMRTPHHQIEVERFIQKGWLKENESIESNP